MNRALTVRALALTAATVTTAITAGCRPGAGAAPRLAQAAAPVAAHGERVRLLAAEAEHSAATAAEGLVKGFVRFLADDAVYLAPGAPVVRGKGAVRALISGAPSSAITGLRWRAVRADISGDATAGYTYGYAEWTAPDTGGTPAPRYGKYISFWRRAERGDWRVAAFVLASSPAPPPADASPPSFESPTAASSPGSAERDGAASVAAARAAMMGTDSAFAAAAQAVGITAAFADYVAPDGAILAGGPSIVYGPAAVRARPSTPSAKLVWAPVLGEVAPSGDLGFTVGEARFEAPDAGGTVRTSYTKYLTVWKKQPSGAWRYVVDGGNDRPGPN